MAKTIVDSKLSWVVCLGIFWTLAFIHGVVRSSGVFYASMVETWGLSREEVSWPFNLCSALNGIGVFLTGISTTTFIIRRGALIAVLIFFCGIALSSLTTNIPLLILLIGLIGGLSQGYLIGTCYILTCHYFDHYRTVATGIAISGSSVGGILFPYLYNYLIQEYGLSSSYLLGAAISSHALIGAMLCRLVSMIEKEGNHIRQQDSFTKEENSSMAMEKRTSGDPEQINYTRNLEKAQARRKEETNRVPKLQANQILEIMQFIKQKLAVTKHPMFYIYAFSFPIGNFCAWSWIIIIVDFAKDRGVTQANATYLLPILSISDLIGRVCYGWFIDFGCVKKKTALIVIFFSLSLNSFLMILFNNFVSLCVSTASYGIFIGCFTTNRAAIPAIYFGIERMPSALGLAGLIITGISLLRPTLIGLIRDKNESYDGIFLTLGALLCMCGVLWLFEYFVMKFYNRTVTVKQQGDI